MLQLIIETQRGRLAFSTIYPLFVDRFGRSLWFCHLDFDEEAIYGGFMAHSCVFREVLNLSDFRALSLCGPG